jgi:hypothetical protein
MKTGPLHIKFMTLRLVITCLLALPTLVLGQSNVGWFCIGAGGGQSASATYSVIGTAGQPNAHSLAGGNYNLLGGFWAIMLTRPASESPQLRIARTGEKIIVAWPAPSTGFELQEASSLLAPVSWNPVLEAPVIMGGEKLVTVPAAGAARFYRLQKP